MFMLIKVKAFAGSTFIFGLMNGYAKQKSVRLGGCCYIGRKATKKKDSIQK
jgi:hypothetical protein